MGCLGFSSSMFIGFDYKQVKFEHVFWFLFLTENMFFVVVKIVLFLFGFVDYDFLC